MILKRSQGKALQMLTGISIHYKGAK